ncbi:MAG: 5-dehydro-4-deoxy-D-glucuronate isomerase [Opitutaceae bacterium]|nr:5-dehydro-4-deoxy-D-glucuronate isomerase [Opitutaceae bacterium]
MKPVPFPLTGLVSRMTTEELRRYFLVTDLFVPGEVKLHWWEVDRTVLGGATPTDTPLALPNHPELRAKFFCERREIGLVNLGGAGAVKVDGKEFKLGKLDGLYIGRGSQEVIFSSADKAAPAKFYLLSFTAHAVHPTTLADLAGAEKLDLGGKDTANERKLCKLIHAGRFPTCQVVMGVTLLQKGSVWNTLPAHTHTRRNEVYLYFDVAADQAVMHFMGEPTETRHLVVRDGQAVLSPVWSIHSGCGTSNYGFVWGMGGENQDYTDMDPAPVTKLL